ncbi:ABC transporter permease [Paraburkholderia sp. BCC1886]|uniref:ABC transporter permease n=1 Tax=Paraburkholderia sp. BCC1886 TaxID=2562670 RepID=UPI001181E6FE|nr:ABC transporter permease [Paraburkholderia sp. BCC1886]
MPDSLDSQNPVFIARQPVRRRGRTLRLLLGLRRWPSALVGGVVLLGIVAIALGAGWLRPGDPLELVAEPFLRPGQDPAYPLGTDMLGRDILSGILHGARASLLIAATSTVLSLLIGITAGLVGGYFGGWADREINRITVFFQTVPPFLFALAIVAIVQPSVATIAIAIGLTSWPNLARLVRAETQKLRHGDMVQASIAIGASDLRIIFSEILPNTLSPVIVSTSLLVATAILTESALAFLGLGDPNIASWGNMVGAGREVLRTDWYIATLPGLAIVVTVLALNLLSDGLAGLLGQRARS